MFDAMGREHLLTHMSAEAMASRAVNTNVDFPPWIMDRDPPEPGQYLVRVGVDLNGDVVKLVRIERWEGDWITLGGYAKPMGWMRMPPV